MGLPGCGNSVKSNEGRKTEEGATLSGRRTSAAMDSIDGLD
jgi:hypothetical protein